MEKLKNEIDATVYQSLIDANIESLPEIILNNIVELEQLANLSAEQLNNVKEKASNIVLQHTFLTADKVPSWERFTTGCTNLDSISRGGIPVNGITEIFGCSGVGKTQICLQLALTVQLPLHRGGKEKGTAYICTEDVFPVKRFHQLASCFKARFDLHHIDFEDNVYLEHIADYKQLQYCLCVRLPNLLRTKNVGLIIIDSIAGVFRSENSEINYKLRGQDINSIASTLNNLGDTYNVAIVCVNQVTENIATKKTEPCLGLAWSNNVTCQFKLTRICNRSPIRQFAVVFAPDLQNNECSFIINESGIDSV